MGNVQNGRFRVKWSFYLLDASLSMHNNIFVSCKNTEVIGQQWPMAYFSNVDVRRLIETVLRGEFIEITSFSRCLSWRKAMPHDVQVRRYQALKAHTFYDEHSKTRITMSFSMQR